MVRPNRTNRRYSPRIRGRRNMRGRNTRCNREGNVRPHRREDQIHWRGTNATNRRDRSETASHGRNDRKRREAKSPTYQRKYERSPEKTSPSKNSERRNREDRDDRNNPSPNSSSSRNHATRKPSAIEHGTRWCPERGERDAVIANLETHQNDENSGQRSPNSENGPSNTAPENQQINYTEDQVEPTPLPVLGFPLVFRSHPPSVNWCPYYGPPRWNPYRFPGHVLPRPRMLLPILPRPPIFHSYYYYYCR